MTKFKEPSTNLKSPGSIGSKGKKDGKFAYTLVPDKCKLIAKRTEIGIHPENQFVFAKKGKKKSRVRGNDAIRNMAKSMGLINAESA